MRRRILTAALPAVLAVGLAVSAVQFTRGGGPIGELVADDAGGVAYGDARAVDETARAASFVSGAGARQMELYLQTQMMAAALAAQAAAAESSGGGGGCAPGDMACIRNCESHGDYGAVSSGGQYRGAYQFDQQTWESVGGTGDPAAASPEEQDQRAATLYSQSGSSPWPNCG